MVPASAAPVPAIQAAAVVASAPAMAVAPARRDLVRGFWGIPGVWSGVVETAIEQPLIKPLTSAYDLKLTALRRPSHERLRRLREADHGQAVRRRLDRPRHPDDDVGLDRAADVVVRVVRVPRDPGAGDLRGAAAERLRRAVLRG